MRTGPRLKLCIGALALFSFFSLPNPATGQESTVIGVQLALTGNAAALGEDVKNILLFANERLAQGRYQLRFEDDKCLGKESVAVAHKFIDIEKIKYVLGFACSTSLLSAAPLYEKARVIAISPVASAPAVSDAGEYIYRTWPSDIQAAHLLASYVGIHHDTVAVLTEETDYARGMEAAFEAAMQPKIRLEKQSFATDTVDFRPLLLRLRNTKAQALFINSQTERTYLNALRQAREQQFSVQIYGAYYPVARNFLDEAKDLANGIIAVDGENPEEALTVEGKQLLAEFKSRYGDIKTVEMVFATGIEAFRALHEAILSGTDPKSYLDTHAFNGLFGIWRFTPKGDILGFGPVLRRIEGGRAVRITQ